MKNFQKRFAIIIFSLLLLCGIFNLILFLQTDKNNSKPYMVEINRITKELEQKAAEEIALSGYTYITHIEKYKNNPAFFEHTDSSYYIQEVNGSLYRFDYTTVAKETKKDILLLFNLMMGIMMLAVVLILLWVRQSILKPFRLLSNMPYELSKGNLTAPIKESQNKFFGKFVWGMNMLRENVEQQKEKELDLQRDKKTLILSISHDIKTPLLAIKLYAKSLSKRLYQSEEKQLEIAEHIHEKADEIEGFISQIIKASQEDFINLEVTMGEFYLSELIEHITSFYSEKLALIKTEFHVENYANCIVKGDLDRSIEVMQNLLENAIKYGDGHEIALLFSEEDDCQLITVQNTGNTLSEAELPHIFESFWRGSNIGTKTGSGLGLYICRQLMHKMNGDIFAEALNGTMRITIVIPKAG